jgi:allantoate deiminase
VRLIAQTRQVAVSLSHDAPAALCDRRLSDLLAASIERCCRMTPVRMPSGAGHDAMSLCGRVPMAMLFVRSKGRVSHHPAEDALGRRHRRRRPGLADFVDTLRPHYIEGAYVT